MASDQDRGISGVSEAPQTSGTGTAPAALLPPAPPAPAGAEAAESRLDKNLNSTADDSGGRGPASASSDGTAAPEEMPSDTGAGKSPTAPPSNEADPPDNAVEVLSDAGEAPPTEVPFYDRFTPLRKRLIVLLVSFAALMGPLGTHFYAPALTTIAEELQASETLVNLTVTIYSIVLSVAPLVWGPLSDRVGRRPIYLASSSVFVVGCLGCFFSANVGMLVAFRFLQGTGSSAVMSVGAGTIADTHRKEERGRAMGMYWVIPLMSPVISSPIGGVVCQYLGWRYVFLISLGLGSVIFLCILVFLPETLPASKRKAKKPPSMLAGIYALRYPFVAFVTLDACCLFAALWSLNSMLPYIYTNAYGFTSSMVGAAMAATACGNLCGSLFGGYYADMTIIKWKRRRNGIMVAEDRLRTTWLAGLCVPIGLLLFGWAPAKGLTVAMAIIGQFLIGYGTLSATSSENTFLIDCFSDSPASIVSANNCVRYLAASVMPVVSPGGVSALGSGWFYTIVAAAKTVGTLSVTWVAARGSRYRLSKEPWASQELVPVKGWYEDWVADVEKKRARREKWFGPAWRAVTGRPGPWEAEGWGGVPPAPPAPGDAQVEVKTLPEGADAQVDVKEVVSK